jgi:hypothetical protein
VVATEPRAPKADYALRGFLARFEEVDRGKAWAGVAEVRVVVVRSSDGTEILRRTYAAESPAPLRNPEGTARALRECLDGIAAVLAADVKVALRREREGELPPSPAGAEPPTESRRE